MKKAHKATNLIMIQQAYTASLTGMAIDYGKLIIINSFGFRSMSINNHRIQLWI